MAIEKITELELEIEALYREAIKTNDKETIKLCIKALHDLKNENTHSDNNS